MSKYRHRIAAFLEAASRAYAADQMKGQTDET